MEPLEDDFYTEVQQTYLHESFNQDFGNSTSTINAYLSMLDRNEISTSEFVIGMRVLAKS